MMAPSGANRFMAMLLCVCILFCPACMMFAEETPAATEESSPSTAVPLSEENLEPAEKDASPIQEPSAAVAPTTVPEQPLPRTETDQDAESENMRADNEELVERSSTEQAALTENSENTSPNIAPSGTAGPDINASDDGSDETATTEPDTEKEEASVPEKQENQEEQTGDGLTEGSETGESILTDGDEPGKDENEEDKQEETTQTEEPVFDGPVGTEAEKTGEIEPEPVDTEPVVTEENATKAIPAETYADKTVDTEPLGEDPAAEALSSGELPVQNMPSYYISIPVTFYRIDENSKSTSLTIDINCVSGFDEGDRVDVSVSSRNNMTLRYGDLDSIEYVLRDGSGVITENHTAFASFSESSSLALRLDVIGSPSYAAEYNDILTFTVTFVPGDSGSV